MNAASALSLDALATTQWDLLVIGGGISGATIMRAAAECGLKVLLVEQRDFASGTSSRSSKLIHGGLHYLARGQFGLARSLVQERERLLNTMHGLVEPVDFLLPIFANDRSRRLSAAGLRLYEAFAGRLRAPYHFDRPRLGEQLAGVRADVLGALVFSEAVVDDARLVIRALTEGKRFGGQAVNYVAVSQLLRDHGGQVVGAVVHDRDEGGEVELRARLVVNATGAWCNNVLAPISNVDRVRLVRGSHLVFPQTRLPIAEALAMRHPDSGEAFYVVPWEGTAIVGSTSVDLGSVDPDDPYPSHEELDYLMRGVRWMFPGLGLGWTDVVSIYSGIRAITDCRTRHAAKASREFTIWDDRGMLTVAGGKLSTAQTIAAEVLARAFGVVIQPPARKPRRIEAPFDTIGSELDSRMSRRLLARYGVDGLAEISRMEPAELRPIPGHRILWAELRWAARREEIRHLDDLLLRRVRLGLTETDGAAHLLESIRPLVQDEVHWDNDLWEREVQLYRALWMRTHGVPSSLRTRNRIDTDLRMSTAVPNVSD